MIERAVNGARHVAQWYCRHSRLFLKSVCRAYVERNHLRRLICPENRTNETRFDRSQEQGHNGGLVIALVINGKKCLRRKFDISGSVLGQTYNRAYCRLAMMPREGYRWYAFAVFRFDKLSSGLLLETDSMYVPKLTALRCIGRHMSYSEACIPFPGITCL